MKTTLVVETITDKAGKVPFITCKTSIGVCNCFDSTVIMLLKTNIQRPISVEVTENGTYKNITKFYGVMNQPEEIKVGPSAPVVVAQPKFNMAPMIMSYVKDLVVADKIKYFDFKSECLQMMEVYNELVGEK